MKTCTRSILTLAIGLVLQPSPAAARKAVNANHEVLRLVVTDRVGLSLSEADAMRRMVNVSMRYTGVTVDWDWRVKDGDPRPLIAPIASTTVPQLEIEIQADKPRGYLNGVRPLGIATIGTDRATLILSGILPLHRTVDIGLGNLIGLVAVHEIGHLLMGRAHSPCGAMLSKWGKWDVMSMLLHRMPFSNVQSKAIREELRRRRLLLEKAYQDPMAQ